MGKLMVAVARVLLFCAVVLLILLVPDKASAAAAITVSPSFGPAGQTVIVTGTGWTQDYIFGRIISLAFPFYNFALCSYGFPGYPL